MKVSDTERNSLFFIGLPLMLLPLPAVFSKLISPEAFYIQYNRVVLVDLYSLFIYTHLSQHGNVRK